MRWDKKEIKYLKDTYPTNISIKKISKTLKRSIKSIRHKSARLGLSRPYIPINKSKNKTYRKGYTKEYYEKHKKRIYANKKKRIKQCKIDIVKMLGGKCKICGYNKCHTAFDFHHKNHDKKDTINRLLKNSSKEKILKEAKKCDLLCSNCHRELHYNLNGDIG